MALTVREILQLQSLQKFKPIAGEKGLDRIVRSAGIADYEFAPGVNCRSETAFEKNSFIITSLLFAKQDKNRIIDAVKELYGFGTAALGFKDVIFDELPEEAIVFSNEYNYPIFKFGEDSCFENIIYEIMDAVQRDDNQILSEAYIKKMIEHDVVKEEVKKISKSVSLLFKTNVMGIYIKAKPGERELDTQRVLHSLYINKNLKNKAMMSKYDRGIFIILTSAYNKPEKFDVILNEVLDSVSIDRGSCFISRSSIHFPYEEFDCCFRESYCTYIASRAEGKEYGRYESIGVFKYLIPLKDEFFLCQFTDNFLDPLADKKELMKTAIILVKNNGEISSTAAECNCHDNTIRYRIARIKELTGDPAKTEFEFYSELSVAVKIYLIHKNACSIG